MKIVLVTGASGFIGSHLCRRLVAEGHKVYGVSRTPTASRSEVINWTAVNLSDYDEVRLCIETIAPDIIFHLASRVTGSRDIREVVPVFHANLQSTVNVLTSAVSVSCKRVVLAGSSEEPKLLNQGSPCSPYAAAKYASTSYAAMFRAIYRLPVVVPRIFMTYGPGQQDLIKLVPYTVLSLLRGQRPKLSSGKRLVDWIYIDDVVEGLIRSGFGPEPEEIVFDLGSGALVAIRQIADQVSEIIGNGLTPEYGALPDRQAEPERVADMSVMERTFSWKPTTELGEGLRRTIEWYSQLLPELKDNDQIFYRPIS